ncbi:MAG: hypothetical protein BWX86_02882 [Verrucomicrobia bacterium ADurb.Bin122]|nr:MAG: hypothetical protein BWX86_02882 [Verrucomicrobia bacterium ADurb.Bin122]
MQQRHFDEAGDGAVVIDLAAIGAEHAVVPVRRVRVEGDVGDHGELGHGGLHGAHGAGHERILAQGDRAVGILQLLVDFAKEVDGRHAEVAERAALGDEVVEVVAEDAGHRRDGLGRAMAIDDE